MKITSRMLPFEVVQEVKDQVNVQIESDRKDLMLFKGSFRYLSLVERITAILKFGLSDREKIRHDIYSGKIFQGQCYSSCHQCCSMSLEYEVEAFDALLSCWLNRASVSTAYLAGRFASSNVWCGMLEDGLCTIHHYKPYVCLLTSPSPRGAEKGGCYFTGERNAKTSVHKQTMVVTRRMRLLFREWLPELPEFAGRNINQAFVWAVKRMKQLR
ncbi:MAG: hypothetical protein KJO60_05585 [Desulfofustis sp.]|nr:hypothetical protein [Desulfofustis sp.]